MQVCVCVCARERDRVVCVNKRGCGDTVMCGVMFGGWGGFLATTWCVCVYVECRFL